MNASSASPQISRLTEDDPQAFTHLLEEKGRGLAAWAGVVVMLCGALVWLGWMADLDFLKRIVPGSVSMNPLTALCFILAGYVLRRRACAGYLHGVTRAVALLVALVGAARLAAYMLGADFRVDQYFFHAALLIDLPGQTNQMAPNTALGFLFYALAVLLPDDTKLRRLQEVLLLVVLFSALLAVLGYTYQVHWMYGVVTFIPMALHTALLFGVLALGSLAARPAQGLTGLFYSPSAGGRLARRLFPALILTFILIGWLRLQGQRQGLLDTDTAVTFYTFVTIFILAALVWWSARSLHIAEQQKRHTQAELDHFFELSLDLLAIAALDGHWRRVNRSFTRTLGYSQEDLLTRRFLDLIHPEHQVQFEQELAGLRKGHPGTALEHRFLHKDGSWRWISWKVLPVRAEGLMYCTGRDVTAEKAAASALHDVNDQLVQKTAMLELANRELEAFSYSVSHDLRAPLRGICGFAQALEEHSAPVLDDTARGYLQRVRMAGDRMSALIDDLLALSRLTRADMRIQNVDLSTMAQEVLADLRENEPGREVETHIEPGLSAWGDPTLLRTLLVNLLGNAWKFTARTEHARIEFTRYEHEAHGMAFVVRDNGVGFDMKYAHKLFSAFQRLHSQAEYPGTGIGLAIVQRVTTRHGGRVWCDSQPGHGASFSFTLQTTPPDT